MKIVSPNKTAYMVSSEKQLHAHFGPRHKMSVLSKPALPVKQSSIMFSILQPAVCQATVDFLSKAMIFFCSVL
jgi:hypothetical protein